MITIKINDKHIEPIVVATVAIVNMDEKRLFVQRRSGKTRFAWHWGLPGGQMHDGESVWDTALREVEEEHGIHLRAGWIGKLVLQEPIYIHESPPSGLAMMGTRVICMRIPHTAIYGSIGANAEAVAGFDWVTANELEALTLTPADDANRGKLMTLIR